VLVIVGAELQRTLSRPHSRVGEGLGGGRDREDEEIIVNRPWVDTPISGMKNYIFYLKKNYVKSRQLRTKCL
jgi:hypothetical protein